MRTDANTQKLGWDSKLREDSFSADIFSDFSGTISEKTKTLPEAIVAKVECPKGEYSRTLSLLEGLNGAGVEGRESQLGNEDEQSQITATVHANSYSNAIPLEKYGIDAAQMSFYDIAQRTQPQLSEWHKQIEGRNKRQAVVELISQNLEKAPTSQTAGINKNVLVADSDGSRSVAYDSTLATFVNSISSSLTAVSDSTNRLSIKVLNDIITWITMTKEIAPVMVGGKPMWFLTVPSRQKQNLFDASVVQGFQSMMVNADVRGSQNQAINYELKQYGPLILCEDPRSPTAVFNNPGGNGTITLGYRSAGSSDDRTLTAGNDNFDIGMVLGKGAILEYEMEKLRFEEEIQNYSRNQGLGAFRTAGWTAGEFDAVTPTSSTRYNKSSGLVLFGSN